MPGIGHVAKGRSPRKEKKNVAKGNFGTYWSSKWNVTKRWLNHNVCLHGWIDESFHLYTKKLKQLIQKCHLTENKCQRKICCRPFLIPAILSRDRSKCLIITLAAFQFKKIHRSIRGRYDLSIYTARYVGRRHAADRARIRYANAATEGRDKNPPRPPTPTSKLASPSPPFALRGGGGEVGGYTAAVLVAMARSGSMLAFTRAACLPLR